MDLILKIRKILSKHMKTLLTAKFKVLLCTVHSNKLMKKGGGIGPVKPWQPPLTE
jgi:hypothetical protein